MAAPAAGHAVRPARTGDRTGAAGYGIAAALLLIAAAVVVPAVTGWNVHVHSFPPLHAEWSPRTGPGTLPAVLVAVLASVTAFRVSERALWRWLLLAAFVSGLLWMLALAYVDGPTGVGAVLDTQYEYLRTARGADDLGYLLHHYVGRIRQDGPGYWPTHVAGHPPGALLFFVMLARLGLASGLAAGLVVTLVAATTPLAVLVTLRALGAERLGRRALPFLVLGPAAVWQAVSADAMFAAVAAWGLAALALSATRRSLVWGAAAGLLLGYTVMLSYGLPIIGILALAVLWASGSWRPLPVSAVWAAAVVGAFAAFGFAYWEALPALHDRYWGGVAGRRPAAYWMWGDLAALMCSAGPLAAAGLFHLLRHRGSIFGPPGAAVAARRPELVVGALAATGWVMVLIADLSQMSRAEVERIWLPFIPWLLLACALLPERWRRAGLALQMAFALVLQHLLFTGW